MKTAVKSIVYSCPDCGLSVNREGTDFCLCAGGHWSKAKWKNDMVSE